MINPEIVLKKYDCEGMAEAVHPLNIVVYKTRLGELRVSVAQYINWFNTSEYCTVNLVCGPSAADAESDEDIIPTRYTPHYKVSEAPENLNEQLRARRAAEEERKAKVKNIIIPSVTPQVSIIAQQTPSKASTETPVVKTPAPKPPINAASVKVPSAADIKI